MVSLLSSLFSPFLAVLSPPTDGKQQKKHHLLKAPSVKQIIIETSARVKHDKWEVFSIRRVRRAEVLQRLKLSDGRSFRYLCSLCWRECNWETFSLCRAPYDVNFVLVGFFPLQFSSSKSLYDLVFVALWTIILFPYDFDRLHVTVSCFAKT